MLDLPARISDSLLMLLHAQRVLAHLVVDDAQNLGQAGGHLAHSGLTGLQSGGLASDQIPFLEGLLPLVETPFLIRSMEMPSGRVADVHFFADDGTVWILLLDVTAEYEEARLVQQKAYDMTLLSQREARLIEQLESANQALTRAHRELAGLVRGGHVQAARVGLVDVVPHLELQPDPLVEEDVGADADHARHRDAREHVR